MKYRLWDTDINRLFGTFESEGEALVLVRTLITRYGDTYADDLALGCERSDGSFLQPLTGAALIARVGQIAVESSAVGRSGPGGQSEEKQTDAESSLKSPFPTAGRLASRAGKQADRAPNAVYQKRKNGRRQAG